MSNKDKIVVSETFFGYIETTKDALLIFEACKRGILPRVKRRLQDKERILIRSGTIFCFDEKESGIKRWTDGFIWSPSRILGNFLIYRELHDKKVSQQQDIIYEQDGFFLPPELQRRQKEKQLVGSLKNSFRFKQQGLIKKSISLVVDGVNQHIISYYNKDHVLSGKLKTPSSIIELSCLKVSSGLKLKHHQKATDNSIEEEGSLKVAQIAKRNTKKKQPHHAPNQTPAEDTPSPYSNISTNSSIDSMVIDDVVPPKNNDTLNLLNVQVDQQMQANHNICLDENFSNINHSHYSPTDPSSYSTMIDCNIASSSSNNYYYSNEFQHNPYQHLYSSASFHSVNHASIISNNIITANAFMEDINAILGWSEFELQM